MVDLQVVGVCVGSSKPDTESGRGAASNLAF